MALPHPVGRAPPLQMLRVGRQGSKNASELGANSAPTATHSPGLSPFLCLLATPFGGPGKDVWVEQPTSHIVRHEDDDVALGVPIAEHTFVIVGPGEDEDRMCCVSDQD